MLVQYRCQPQNKGSAAVARACGFALLGVLAVAPLPGS
jgi:RimJ/RimL family protein N-acetyltransferase